MLSCIILGHGKNKMLPPSTLFRSLSMAKSFARVNNNSNATWGISFNDRLGHGLKLFTAAAPFCRIHTSRSLLDDDKYRPPIKSCPTCNIPVPQGTGGFYQCPKCNGLYTEEAARFLSEDDTTNNESDILGEVKSPKELHEHMDMYCIGQNMAKKVMSVGVYHHYKKLQASEKSKMRGNPNQMSLPPASETKPGPQKYMKVGERLFKIPQDESTRPWLISEVGESDEAAVLEESSVFASNGSNNNGPYNNNDGTLEFEKSNILMLGPTGSGKTLLAKTLAKFLNVPISICDCTVLTQAGYVGEDIESIVSKLLKEANGDVAKAQRGIIFLDEVDKIAKASGTNATSRDVSGEGVQQGLLKIIEGTVVNIAEGGRRKTPRSEYLGVDTTNILFICSGAFPGLEGIVGERMTKDLSGMGFGNDVKEEGGDMDIFLQDFEPKDLIQFGMIAEFVGRFPVRVSTNHLSKNDLIRIMTEPKNAIVHQYRQLLAYDDIQLYITMDGLAMIAEKSMELKVGARGLRSEWEKLLLEPCYDAPGAEIHAIIIDEEAVKNCAPRIITNEDIMEEDELPEVASGQQ